jgi:hypothetical protein
MERKCRMAPVCAVMRMHADVKTPTSQNHSRSLIPIDVMPFGSGMIPCALGLRILLLTRGASILQDTS